MLDFDTAKHLETTLFGQEPVDLFAVDPDNTRPVVVHLNALDLKYVITLRWSTTPTATIGPIIPGSLVSTLPKCTAVTKTRVVPKRTYQTMLPGTVGTFFFIAPTYSPST